MPSRFVFRRLASLTMLTTIVALLSHEASAQLVFDFEDVQLPAGTQVYDAASINTDDTDRNFCLRLTETVLYQSGHFRVANVGEGKTVRQLRVQWRSLIGGGPAGGADGYSLNWATDLPSTPSYNNPGEAGGGSGLSVTVDTYDNGNGEAPGLEIRWRSNIVAFVAVPTEDSGGGLPFLRRNAFVNAELTVDAGGVATFTYDGISISAQLNGWKGISRGDLLFSARTGGASDRQWIDDVRITTGVFAAGTFSGLFGNNEQPTHDNRGAITLRLTPQGSYSGTLMLGGTRLPLTGRFDPETARAVTSIPRLGTTSITVDMSLRDKNSILGTVGDGTWTERVSAERVVWDKKLNPSTNYAGPYTVRVGTGRQPGVPNGFGYGTLTVDTAGGVKFVGVLGDGSKVTQKTTLSPRSTVPIYLVTHRGAGSLQGWVFVRSHGETDSEVAWYRKPGVPGALYPAGFSLSPEILVASYQPPSPGEQILPLGNGAASFFSGEVDFTSPFTLTLANQVIGLDNQQLSVRFVPKTGLFTGTVLVPQSNTKLKFGGVAIQSRGTGFGTFLGTTQSGAVVLRNSP